MPTRKKKIHPLRTYIDGLPNAGNARFGRTHPCVVELAKKSKLSVEAIYRVARGEYNLRAKNAAALSKATGGIVSAASLAGLE